MILRSRLYAVVCQDFCCLHTISSNSYTILNAIGFSVVFQYVLKDSEFSRLKAVGIFEVHHHIGSRFKTNHFILPESAGAATHKYSTGILNCI